VSHHLDEVFEISDRVTVLRDGRRVGTYGSHELTHQDLVNVIVGEAHVMDDRHEAPAPLPTQPPSRERLVVRGLTAEGVEDISFDVAEGEVVGIAGVAGSGREAVLPAVFGALDRSGDVSLDGHRLMPGRPDRAIKKRVVMVPSDRATQGMFGELTIRENLCMAGPAERGLKRIHRKAELAEVRTWISTLNIRPRDPEALVATASGGNQQKAVLARALRLDPKLMLLNDPTQGVDVGARAEIHRIIRDSARKGAAVLVASADDEELVEVCDRVLVMQRGRVQVELVGDELNATAVATAVLGA